MKDKPFRETLSYPVIFMLIVCIIFVGILAVMYRISEPRIEAQQKDSYQKLILELFSTELAQKSNVPPLAIMAGYPETYNSFIRETKLPGVERRTFCAVYGDSLLGYCFDIGGKGLWGSMRALVALSPDLTTMKGLNVYSQEETPGLGARIDEQWFRDQFQNLPVVIPAESQVLKFELIPEGKSAETPNQIRQITGATITTNSVVKMLTDEINYIYQAAKKGQP